MFTLTSYFIILVGAALSLLLAYGRIRWFGKKFHRAIYAVNVLEIFSFMFFFYLLARQTTSIWRPCLMTAAAFAWIVATFWSRQIEQAQKKISEGAVVAEEKQR